ncbi:MAG TPA: hypothetical protein VGA21_08985 [Cyclobacteriaceae bacterium]|jgi:hypothetical protein
MIKNGILFLIASLIFASCIHIVEDNTTIVKGYIREIRSGKPIEGAGAYLSFKPFLKPEETITHFDNISDSNGYYEIKFEADRGNGYKIAIGRQGYYCNQCNEPVKSGEENTLNVYLVPTAEFTLNLVNDIPYNDSDSIYFCMDGEHLLSNDKECLYCLGPCNENVFRNYTFESNATINLTWWVTENGITTPYSHDIELVSVDTVEYTIRY